MQFLILTLQLFQPTARTSGFYWCDTNRRLLQRRDCLFIPKLTVMFCVSAICLLRADLSSVLCPEAQECEHTPHSDQSLIPGPGESWSTDSHWLVTWASWETQVKRACFWEISIWYVSWKTHTRCLPRLVQWHWWFRCSVNIVKARKEISWNKTEWLESDYY